jgi:hypothetical protein
MSANAFVSGNSASEWRNAQNARAAKNTYEQMQREQQDRRARDDYGSFGKAHTKPSGLGVQIDAMIQRLIDDGHSPTNIARVMRLRADKLEASA